MNSRTIFSHHAESDEVEQSIPTATSCFAETTPVSGRDLSSDSSSCLTLAEQLSLWRRQALHYARQGNYSPAITLFSRLIQRSGAQASDYNNRGLLLFQVGQPERALADYNQALQLDPKLTQVYNNRANCYAAIGCLAEALADYETAIDLNPTNLHAWLNQGITYRDLEMYEQAIENFDLALQFSQLLNLTSDTPTHIQGHLYAERGRTYHLAGDWNCAVADYQRALAALPQADRSFQPSCKLWFQVDHWLNELLTYTP